MAQIQYLNSIASEYAIVAPSHYHLFLGIFVKKMYPDKGESWAIYLGNSVFSKRARCFVMDTNPSERSEEFLKDKRFNSAEEATECLLKSAGEISEHFLNQEVSSFVLEKLLEVKNNIETNSGQQISNCPPVKR